MKINNKGGVWVILFIITLAVYMLDSTSLKLLLWGSGSNVVPIILTIISGALVGYYYVLVIKDMDKYHLKMLLFAVVNILVDIVSSHNGFSISIKTLVLFMPLISFAVAKMIFVNAKKDFAIPIILALGLIIMLLVQMNIFTHIIKYVVAIIVECIGYAVLSKKSKQQ